MASVDSCLVTFWYNTVMQVTSKWSIVGHGALLSFLDLAIERDNIHHAYVFEGKESIGKETVARQMFARMFNVELDQLVQSPDLIIVEREINPKTKKLRELISVDQIKDARNRFQHSSLGKWKLMIIKDAHMMSDGASNALLKTLEEPQGNACIVMTTTHASHLLATIQSRAQVISFKPVPREEICDALKLTMGSRDDAHEIAGFSAGCPGVAIRLANSPEAREEMNEDRQRARACLGSSAPSRVLAAKKLLPEYNEDHVKTRRKLLERVNMLEAIARDDLLREIGCNELTVDQSDRSSLSKDQAVESIKGTVELKKQLAMHINPKMALINLMLKIG